MYLFFHIDGATHIIDDSLFIFSIIIEKEHRSNHLKASAMAETVYSLLIVSNALFPPSLVTVYYTTTQHYS